MSRRCSRSSTTTNHEACEGRNWSSILERLGNPADTGSTFSGLRRYDC